MSSNETNLVPTELNGVAAFPAPRHASGEAIAWAAPMSEVRGPGVGRYLHAFRRHWFIATFFGLLAAAAVAVGTWIGYGTRYEAAAYLRVPMKEDRVMRSTPGYADNATDYDIFKNTQLQLVKSRLVLMSALRNEKVVALKLKTERGVNDPMTWLADELIVRYPGRAEIMEVAMRSRNDQELPKVLVQAVVDAYLDEIVNVDHRMRRERLNDLDRIYGDTESEVRRIRTQLKALAENANASDKETITLKQQIVLQQYADYQRQLMTAQYEMRRTKGELDAQIALLEAVENQQFSDVEVDQLVRNDPVAREMQTELAWRRMDMAYILTHTADAKKDKYLSKYKTDFDSLQSQLGEVYTSMREGLRAMRKSEIEKDKHKLEAQFAGLLEFERGLTKEVEAKRKEAEALGSQTIEMEITRNQIAQAENTLKQVHEERERLRLEQKAAPRVTLLQPADTPQGEYMPSIRYLLASLAGVVAFVIPVGLVVWGDSRSFKVNSVNEVSRHVGIPVVGTLPIIPGRVARRLGHSSRHRGWQERLMEAVDSVAARVLRTAAAEDARVVLVTSAADGEGKTTVATQLAMSLARNGRSTVLVDANLRRPMLDRVFDLPDTPGFCEWLRGEAAVAEIVHATPHDSLSAIAAGQWDRQALAALAKGNVGELFSQLRQQFDFVVIDGSPVLPVADTRFVSQHVDMALVTVFRDVSQLPKVQAACEILEAFGTRRLETVVMGPGDVGGDRYGG